MADAIALHLHKKIDAMDIEFILEKFSKYMENKVWKTLSYNSRKEYL